MAVDGTDLYIAGVFGGGLNPNSTQVPSKHFIKWNGSAYSPMGPDGNWQPDGYHVIQYPQTITVLGSDIFVSGNLGCGSSPGSGLYRYSKTAPSGWYDPAGTALSFGSSYSGNSGAQTCVRNGKLYLIGCFDAVGGTLVNNVAQWDGQSWTSLDGGIGVNPNNYSEQSPAPFGIAADTQAVYFQGYWITPPDGNGNSLELGQCARWFFRQDDIVSRPITAGNCATLHVRSNGDVWGAGANNYGSLGAGYYSNQEPTPVRAKLAGIAAISQGENFTLALAYDGTILCFGSNTGGRLGIGNTVPNYTATPLKVQFPGRAIDIANWRNGYAIRDDGTVWAWALNQSGQLGNGTTNYSLVPVRVGTGVSGFDNGTPVQRIAAGLNYALALKADGTVWAWGANGSGQLGNGTTVYSAIPVQVIIDDGASSKLTGVVQIAAGTGHSLAVTANGDLYVWGGNNAGQLDVSVVTENYLSKARKIRSGVSTGLFSITGGQNYSIACMADRSILSWGVLDPNYDYGQLGRIAPPNGASPLMATSTGATLIGCFGHYYHNVALDSNGAVYTWGYNTAGELGNGSYDALYLPPADYIHPQPTQESGF